MILFWGIFHHYELEHGWGGDFQIVHTYLVKMLEMTEIQQMKYDMSQGEEEA